MWRRYRAVPYELALALGAALSLAGCQMREAKPDIVVYVVDTLRADALGAYRGERGRTPHFDRVASEGALFQRAYANSSWTRPSVASLLTGHNPQTHGARGRMDRLRPDLPTLAELLRANGYRTAAVIANPNLASAFGLARGFEQYLELYEPVDRVRPIEPQELIASAERVVDQALRWWRSVQDAPRFLFVFSVDPHAPYTPPAPYDRKFDPDYRGDYDGSFQSLFRLAVAGTAADPRDLLHVRALYDGEVAYADEHFGRLLAELDGTPISHAPLLVVTADHGEEFLEHGKLDHGQSLYEEVVRIPLLIRWRGRIRPQEVTIPASLVDLFPTILGFAEIPSPPCAGRNLAFPLRARQLPPTAPVLLDLTLTQPPWQGLVEGNAKVLQHGTQMWFFDLERDPNEKHPLQPPLEITQRFVRLLELASRSQATPGAAVTLPPHAQEALKALGYEQLLRHEGSPTPLVGDERGDP